MQLSTQHGKAKNVKQGEIMKANLDSSVQRPTPVSAAPAKSGNQIGKPSEWNGIKTTAGQVVSGMDSFSTNNSSVRPIDTTGGV